MQRGVWFAAIFVVSAGVFPARADTVRPVRPGVMCLSARALAALTLPDGDSRSHGATPRGGDRQLADAGGCIDLSPDMRLSVVHAYHNTSEVMLAAQGGGGGSLYTVPNIDLQGSDGRLGQEAHSAALADRTLPGAPVGTAVDAYVVAERFQVRGTGQTIELLQDRRISPQVFNDLWRAGRRGRDSERSAGLLPGGPLLAARLRLASGDSTQVEMRDLGYPLAALSAQEDGSATFRLYVDTTGSQAGRILEEELRPAEHGLAAKDSRV